MTVVEKNDVDISKLFHYGDEFAITGKGLETSTIYMRLVGDAEINRARIFAIRKSAELRKKLRTPDSDERIAFIPSLDDITKEELIQMIVKYSINDFARKAVKEVVMVYPKEPASDAPLEKHEEYQALVDDFEKERNKKAEKLVEKQVKDLEKELGKETLENLLKKYENLVISNLCEQEMVQKFKEMCVVFGTFKDKKYSNRVFTSYEVFENITPDLKGQLLDCYAVLEISIDNLKK
jgi:hypothetical protein